MPEKRILLVLPYNSGSVVERQVLRPAGYATTLISSYQAAIEFLKTNAPEALIIGDRIEGGNSLELAQSISSRDPAIAMIMLPEKHREELPAQALRSGFSDYLHPPVKVDEVLQAVELALGRRHRWLEWGYRQTDLNTHDMEQRLADLQKMQQIGLQVVSSLDLEDVYTTVVNSAIALAQADESSLLLLDENSGELFLCASRDANDQQAKICRLPIRDALAGQVLRTGKPLSVNEMTHHNIRNAYLVHTLIYAPLIFDDRVMGVLGVYNRVEGRPFSEYHLSLTANLAKAAATAIENARLYTKLTLDRDRLETVLTKIEDGFLFLDLDDRVLFINQTVRDVFNLGSGALTGKHFQDVFHHPDLIDLLDEKKRQTARRMEIKLDDSRVFTAQFTPIPTIGLAVTMQDISHYKELDQIKTDFVNTVSHDLRSPLTSILGYVELLDRVGPVNELQQEFIQRIRSSVSSITSLINDLFDLGRIEAGFDIRKEIMDFNTVVDQAIDVLRSQLEEKNQTLVVDIAAELPEILGDPTRLRRMIQNLLINAHQFSPSYSRIEVHVSAEAGQIVLQIADNGVGIPKADQPFIFDKFYRGSNVPADITGSGLGLALVKSIVENHQGRIWVESMPNQGTTFTVVIPIANHTL